VIETLAGAEAARAANEEGHQPTHIERIWPPTPTAAKIRAVESITVGFPMWSSRSA
jgi:hypothetical protein